FSWLRVAYVHALAPKLVFASLFALNSHLRPIYLDLNAKLGPDNAGCERYWTICSDCGGRQSVRKKMGQSLVECTNCGVRKKSPDPSKDERIQIIPKVVVDVLSDYVGLDVSGGTSYASSWPHIAKSHVLGLRIGVPPRREAAWPSDILHTGPAGRTAYDRFGSRPPSMELRDILVTGRMSLAYYLGLPT